MKVFVAASFVAMLLSMAYAAAAMTALCEAMAIMAGGAWVG